jgi:hypothetical protein
MNNFINLRSDKPINNPKKNIDQWQQIFTVLLVIYYMDTPVAYDCPCQFIHNRVYFGYFSVDLEVRMMRSEKLEEIEEKKEEGKVKERREKGGKEGGKRWKEDKKGEEWGRRGKKGERRVKEGGKEGEKKGERRDNKRGRREKEEERREKER